MLSILNYAALSFAVVVTPWGTRQIAERLEELGAEPFRAINNVVGPLLGHGRDRHCFRGRRLCPRRLGVWPAERSDLADPRNRVLVVPLDLRLAPTRC